MSTSLSPVVDAEIVEPLHREDAERLDKRIRLLVGTINDQIAKLYELVQQAKHGNLHVALGFPSWTAYLADVFTIDVRLEREQRRELVGYLSGEGMSQRTIADVVGVSQDTVRRDISSGERNRSPDLDEEELIAAKPAPVVTGRDGRTYKRKPKQMTRDEAEELMEACRVALRAAVSGYLRAAKDLIDAKAQLPHPDWVSVVESLGADTLDELIEALSIVRDEMR